ncbi:MAG: metalloregulator ArsR/SmtB family transcription factor [Spirochaetia bacterium]|nr:metalloregulator ArsR/SmtB family transcription factor [Spirochaetia bacterium]
MKTLKEKDYLTAAKGLKALSHPARLSILCHLQNKESTVNDLVNYTKMSQSAVSQHLSKMKASDILRDRREGNKVYYFVADSRFEKLVTALCHIYSEK